MVCITAPPVLRLVYKLNTDGSFIGNLNKAGEVVLSKTIVAIGREVLLGLQEQLLVLLLNFGLLEMASLSAINFIFNLLLLNWMPLLLTFWTMATTFPDPYPLLLMAAGSFSTRFLIIRFSTVSGRSIDVVMLWQKAELIFLVILFLFICPLIVFWIRLGFMSCVQLIVGTTVAVP